MLSKPLEIPYERWRSIRKGYEVKIVGVYHTQGPNGWYTTVKAVTSEGRTNTWPGTVFLRDFEPLGSKIRVPTRWERIRRKDKF